MPSDPESFLKIDETPQHVKASGLVNQWLAWVGVLIGSYALSFFWLTGAVVFVPIVIKNAPLGVTSIFDPPVNHANARTTLGPAEMALHGIFWTLYFVGLFGCKHLDRRLLRAMFLAVVVLLILTMYGCATYYHMDTSQWH